MPVLHMDRRELSGNEEREITLNQDDQIIFFSLINSSKIILYINHICNICFCEFIYSSRLEKYVSNEFSC